MNAKLAFTAISQIPLFGSRAAAISPSYSPKIAD
jgi:hypothetical protein